MIKEGICSCNSDTLVCRQQYQGHFAAISRSYVFILLGAVEVPEDIFNHQNIVNGVLSINITVVLV